MLETMLTAGGTGKHYPNSGPGPQTLLFGDTEEGYFGRVPVGEMITGGEVKAQPRSRCVMLGAPRATSIRTRMITVAQHIDGQLP